jgi:hypothetical protein
MVECRFRISIFEFGIYSVVFLEVVQSCKLRKLFLGHYSGIIAVDFGKQRGYNRNEWEDQEAST